MQMLLFKGLYTNINLRGACPSIHCERKQPDTVNLWSAHFGLWANCSALPLQCYVTVGLFYIIIVPMSYSTHGMIYKGGQRSRAIFKWWSSDWNSIMQRHPTVSHLYCYHNSSCKNQAASPKWTPTPPQVNVAKARFTIGSDGQIYRVEVYNSLLAYERAGPWKWANFSKTRNRVCNMCLFWQNHSRNVTSIICLL